MENNFSIKEAFLFGWLETKKKFWFLVGVVFIIFAVYNISALVVYLAGGSLKSLVFLLSLAFFILGVLVEIGMVRMLLDIYDSGRTALKVLFFQHRFFIDYFIALFVYSLVISLFTVPGAVTVRDLLIGRELEAGMIITLILMVPGIMAAVIFQFFRFAIVDKGAGIIESFKKSAEITRGRRWKVFLFNLAVLGLNFLGVAVFGIGILISLPVSLLATAHVYRALEKKTPSLENEA